MRNAIRFVIVLLLAICVVEDDRGADHQQPDSRADCETRICGRDQGCRAPSGHARDSSCRSGRVACRMGAQSATCAICLTAAASPTIRAASST